MSREVGFVAYLLVTAFIGFSVGVLVRRRRWTPTALGIVGVAMLVCAMWLTWVGVTMGQFNRAHNPAHIPLPGPSFPTGVAVTLFGFTGLGLSGLLMSALALPAKGRHRVVLKLACALIGLYAPCAAFWAIMLMAK